MPILDDTDLRILRAMQSDGSMTVSQIAEKAGLSQSPCSKRIIQLQEAGVITGKTVNVDRKMLGYHEMVVTRVKLAKHDSATLENFKREIMAIPEIQFAALVMGRYDYDLHLIVRDMEHYQLLLQNQLSTLSNVKEMESSVMLEIIKKTAVIPI